jgi:uncharacterized iron-regulated membrane protein
MRKFHRWLSVLFGVFLLWIAATGVLSQIVPIVQRGGFESETATRGRAQAAVVGQAIVPAARAHEDDEAAPAKFVCPADMVCRPKPRADDPRRIVGLLHHLHSGESFGPLGVVISTLSGLALLFFAFSGLWMYLQLWRGRKDRGLKPGWFWS